MMFVLWYLAGFVASSAFILILNRKFGSNLSWGDVGIILFLSLGGPLTVAALLLFAFVCGIIWFASRPFWGKPVFSENRWKD